MGTVYKHNNLKFYITIRSSSSSSSSVSSSSVSSSSMSSSSISSSSSVSSSSSSTSVQGLNWVSYFDDTYWMPYNSAFGIYLGTWNSEDNTWNSGLFAGGPFEVIELKDIVEPTPWVSGFRPSKLRVSFTDGNIPPSGIVYLNDSSSNPLIEETIITEDKQEIDITFLGNDIDGIMILELNSVRFSISDIEFAE